MNLLARLNYLIKEGFDWREAVDIVNAENDVPEIRVVKHWDGTRRIR